MDEKTCFKCGEVKSLDDFYRHPRMADGHLGKCKECTKQDVSANYRKNVCRYAEYEHNRYQQAERRQYVHRHARQRRLQQPQKYKAKHAVNNAIRDGRLIRMPCEVCGNPKSQAHHEDYNKPLDVVWLCRVHHLERHGKVSYALLDT